MPAFKSILDLSTLTGTNGFQINGESAGDGAGFTVASAGDINGDGYADLIVGAPDADPHGAGSGASYVVFGKASGFSANLDLSSLNGASGFQISGEAAGDHSGFSVASAGDINGDGYDDMIIGSHRDASPSADGGSSYVLFGKGSGFSANLDLSSLNGANGFEIHGVAAGDQSGYSVASAGDFNGDGYADLIIGAHAADPNGAESGASYVVYGKKSGYAADMNLSSLNGANGFRISGESASDLSGHVVASAGDINGDGRDDLILGVLNKSTNGAGAGASYVVFGQGSGMHANLDLADLDGTNGFRLDGEDESDWSGSSAASAGDVNGDGYDDLIIGAALADADSLMTGAAYVVFGKETGYQPKMQLSSLDGSNGFRISGAGGGDFVGTSVRSAGDINGDGYDDMIIGAPFADGKGASYVVFGKADGFAANLDVTSLNGSNGFKITGEAKDDWHGHSVAGAGDVNGDGFDDMIIGADNADPHGTDSGASHVIFGHATGALNRTGTSGNDILSGGEWDDMFQGLGGDDHIRGGAGDDIIDGGADNDRLDGGSGHDVVVGGSGNDTFVISSGLDTLSGGTGSDTLDFSHTTPSGTLTVDLTKSSFVSPSGQVQTFSSMENVIGTSGKDIITGNGVANTLSGLGGNDTINGGAGIDTMIGGDGSDIYFADSASDKIVETNASLLTGGKDVVHFSGSSGTFVLGGNVENLALDGTSAINGTGNKLANAISGNSAANVLNGMVGMDILSGGKGTDMLTGGADADTFVFKTGFGKDTITDFENGKDHIDISGWVAIDDFADLKAHHLSVSGTDLIINAGTDKLVLHDTTKSELDASDFLF